MMKAHYTAHMCWAWLVEEALAENFSAERCTTYKTLPSMSSLQSKEARSHAGYALWRVEVEGRAAWCTSRCFEHLDAKDALFAELQEQQADYCMPPTTLLRWDCCATEAEDNIDKFINTHGTVMLKGALGAGGFGLYLVSTAQDCLAVMSAHAARARETEGFLAKLERDYGGTVPHWSLQAKLSPVLVGAAGRKSQVRAYVCCLEKERGGTLFIYETLEVRLPIWSEAEGGQGIVSLHEQEMLDYEANICRGSGARAYNSGRQKRDTERMLLCECSELNGAQEAVISCLEAALGALRRGIFSRITAPCTSRLAIVGVDLLISRDPSTSLLTAHILEVNNNPAMPDPLKHKMSALYRQHLVDYCTRQITLGLTGGESHQGFRPCP